MEFSCGYNEKLSMQRRNLRDDFKVRQGVDKQLKNGDGQLKNRHRRVRKVVYFGIKGMLKSC